MVPAVSILYSICHISATYLPQNHILTKAVEYRKSLENKALLWHCSVFLFLFVADVADKNINIYIKKVI